MIGSGVSIDLAPTMEILHGAAAGDESARTRLAEMLRNAPTDYLDEIWDAALAEAKLAGETARASAPAQPPKPESWIDGHWTAEGGHVPCPDPTHATCGDLSHTQVRNPALDAWAALDPSGLEISVRDARKALLLAEIRRAAGRGRHKQSVRRRDLNSRLNGSESYAQVVLPGSDVPIWADSLDCEITVDTYPRCSTASAFRAAERGGRTEIRVWLPLGTIWIDLECSVSRGRKERAQRTASEYTIEGWRKVAVKSGWTRGRE